MRFFRREKSEAERSLDQLQRAAAAPTAPAAPAAPAAPTGAPGTSFSMPVEDVFTITGRGTVVTGRVAVGSVTVGQAVTIRRADGGSVEATVTGVEMFRKIVDTASAGDNVGLLVRGVRREDVARGDVVSA